MQRHVNVVQQHVCVPELGRLICRHETFERRFRRVASVASGLLERASLDHETRLELGLRLDETEEGMRFSKLKIDELVAYVKWAGWLDHLRKQIEKSGRYNSPV